jgi:hypothetical protein
LTIYLFTSIQAGAEIGCRIGNSNHESLDHF